MGQVFAGPKGCTIQNDDGVRLCVPYTTYSPLPASKRGVTGNRIAEFKALPTVQDTADYYWVVKCQYRPNDDTTLFVTSSAYLPQHMGPPLRVSKIPAGKVCKFDLKPERIKCELIKHTGSFSFPKVQIHPDSDYISYLDNVEIKILHSTINSGIHNKAFEVGFRRYKSFALSPNGSWMCILAKESRQNYDLIVFQVNTRMYAESTIHCTKLHQHFSGSRWGEEICDCKWSPDSCYIAVSLSTGHLLLICFKTEQIICSVFREILDKQEVYISFVSAFDFDCRSCHKIMAVGDSDGYLDIIDCEDKTVICRSGLFKDHVQQSTLDKFNDHKINSVKYSYDGSFIAVCLHSYSIFLCDANSCDILFYINMLDTCPDLDSRNGTYYMYPNITCIDLSQSGEQLVTCCSDGYARVWQLPPNINLKNLCKLKILSLVYKGNIRSLPLPLAMKDFLLPFPS